MNRVKNETNWPWNENTAYQHMEARGLRPSGSRIDPSDPEPRSLMECVELYIKPFGYLYNEDTAAQEVEREYSPEHLEALEPDALAERQAELPAFMRCTLDARELARERVGLVYDEIEHAMNAYRSDERHQHLHEWENTPKNSRHAVAFDMHKRRVKNPGTHTDITIPLADSVRNEDGDLVRVTWTLKGKARAWSVIEIDCDYHVDKDTLEDGHTAKICDDLLRSYGDNPRTLDDEELLRTINKAIKVCSGNREALARRVNRL